MTQSSFGCKDRRGLVVYVRPKLRPIRLDLYAKELDVSVSDWVWFPAASNRTRTWSFVSVFLETLWQIVGKIRPRLGQQAASAGAGATDRGAVLMRSGEFWTVGRDGETFLLADMKGLGYLELLVQHPGSEFHALDLLAGSETFGTKAASDEILAQLRERPDVSIRTLGDAGAMLDDQAKLQYKHRLRELNAELEDLRERGDANRALTIESEIDFLTREVLRATGLGGRSRRSGSDAERARISVSRALRNAIQRISEHDGQLRDPSRRNPYRHLLQL